MKNVLLLGSSGYLGSFLKRELSEHDINLVSINREKISINKKGFFDYIIFCNADTKNLFDEQKQKSVFDYLTYYKNNFNSKFIFFSSYYVYDSLGFSTETSKTTSAYAYSKYKLLSEEILGSSDLILRLGKIFGNPYRKNYNLIDIASRCKEIFVDNCFFNPVSVFEILDIILIELYQNTFSGIYNLGNGITTHYECVKTISEIENKKCNINLCKTRSTQIPNYGRFCMNLSKIKQKITLRNWIEDYKKYVKLRGNYG